ncbi:MAG: efflux RND transporter periplasmic adaptor subunit [Planctomycetota bacterium]|nr:efflux RND transporter periplasmic adaptor subunit [Planctomycetota bacterium]MDA1261613.1 efflux RND transporter periplasmic adaptor subunit [Planctomycetota bacterium]
MTTNIPLPSARIGTRIVLPLIIIGSAVAILAWSSWRVWAPLTVVHAIPVIVRTTAITQGATENSANGHPILPMKSSARGPVVQAPGWIEPSPFPISASALTPGVVREVLILEGDQVKEGQVVARLIDDQAKIELRRANSEVDIKAAEVSVMRDELNRKSKLVASGSVSEGEIARLAIRIQGADATLEQVRAMRDQVALVLARTEVRSPVAGVVMARLTAPGSFVGMDAESAPVVQLFDPKILQVRTDVPLADAGRLAIGQTAEVQVDSLPGVIVRGRVIRLVQQADIAKNTLQVKVLLDDPPIGLVPDMLARVKIQTGAISATGGVRDASSASSMSDASRAEIAAPSSALRHIVENAEGNRSGQVRVVVDMRDQVGRIEMRLVTCAAQDGADGWTTIYDGLRPGDLVVLDDSPATDAGEMVRIREMPIESSAKEEHDAHR